MGEKALTEREQKTMLAIFNETVGVVQGILNTLEVLNDVDHTKETIAFRIEHERERLNNLKNDLRELNETFKQLDETEFY